jgi:hypothetical protein
MPTLRHIYDDDTLGGTLEFLKIFNNIILKNIQPE